MNTLSTTNVLLAIMTAMSLLEALAFLALLASVVLLMKKMTDAIAGIERQHVQPVSARVAAILDDVKDVTSTIKESTQRIERVVKWGTKFAGQ